MSRHVCLHDLGSSSPRLQLSLILNALKGRSCSPGSGQLLMAISLRVKVWASPSQLHVRDISLPAALLVRSSKKHNRVGQRVAAWGLMKHSASAICSCCLCLAVVWGSVACSVT